MKTNILYDISVLGISQRDRKNFGISRTTEALLQALLDRPDLSLMASSDLSFNVWYYARIYLENSDFSDRLPWLSNSLNAQVRDKITQLFFNESWL